MLIQDEHGGKWVVLAGDPASRAVNTLRRKNYGWIVLPVETFATGEVVEVEGEGDVTLESLRLADCLAALED